MKLFRYLHFIFFFALFFFVSAQSAYAGTAWQPQSDWGVELINRDTSGGSGDSTDSGVNAMEPAISKDGRYILYTSRATNIVPGTDTNGHELDSILHDRVTGQNEYADVNEEGDQTASPALAISDDGRYTIAPFLDHQTNTIASPGNGNYGFTFSANNRYISSIGGTSAYVLDRNSDQSTVVSKKADGSNFTSVFGPIGLESTMSGNGRYVIFSSDEDDQNSGDTNGKRDVYVRNVVDGKTIWVSKQLPSIDVREACDATSLSRNGRYAVYRCSAVIGTSGLYVVYVTELSTGETEVASLDDNGEIFTNGGGGTASISPDGRYIGFGVVIDNTTQYAIRDRLTNHTALLTQEEGGIGLGNSSALGHATFSGDSRWIVFDSRANNLGPENVTISSNVYLRPLPFNVTEPPTDTTAPVVSNPSWTVNPKFTNQQSTLTVTVSDDLSGIYTGEYFIGNTDPGQGNGIEMTWQGARLSANFGTNLLQGTYDINVRVQDNVGNWSSLTTTQLVVVNALPVTVTFNSVADTYVRSGLTNHNQGGSQFMQVQSSGDNRGLVRFDQNVMQSSISGNVISAKLRLTITDTMGSWGTTGRTVDVHRLISDWVEGNGTENDKGTGSGATWNCAIDSIISNTAKNCSGSTEWNMGQPSNHPWMQAATDTEVIITNQTGIVEYDVTSDVAAFMNGTSNYGWLIKKTNENQTGQVSFGTRESSSVPQLVVTYQP
jgi:hypothetical protein